MASFYMDSSCRAYLDRAPRALMREADEDHRQRPRWRPTGRTTTATPTQAQKKKQAQEQQERRPAGKYAGERLSTEQTREVHKEAARVAKATSSLNKEILEFAEDLHVARALMRAQLASIRDKLSSPGDEK